MTQEDLFGNSLTVKIEEPISAEDIMEKIEKCQEKIPIYVTRSGKKVLRYLSQCKPKEIILFVKKCIYEGYMPTVIDE